MAQHRSVPAWLGNASDTQPGGGNSAFSQPDVIVVRTGHVSKTADWPTLDAEKTGAPGIKRVCRYNLWSPKEAHYYLFMG